MSPKRPGAARLKKLLLVAGACGLTVVGASAFVHAAMLQAAHDKLYTSPNATPDQSVAIVLGARVNGIEPSAILEDRLAGALALWKAGKVQRILVSGDHRDDQYNEVRGMHLWLRRHGVPAGDVFLDHAGYRTFDTMVRARLVFGVTRAVVVTQEFHMARALFLATHAGIDAVGYAADLRRYQDHGHNQFREFFACAAAWLDVHAFGPSSIPIAESLPITGDAAATWDEVTRRDERLLQEEAASPSAVE